ncbi:hypothetical protein SNE40_017434 [Patella caerulea]|uniref:Reverse transcriptase domain-containing protein n=1 Tax=Patella caerulea TaxID=87958 RepID=A0AAN8JH32_PATCE
MSPSLFNGTTLDEFPPASFEEIKNLILKSSSKCCDLDPIPTWLIKHCIDELVPVIAHIVNTSLNLGDVSSILKSALVNPLLKKSNLDRNVLKNFRPVSNLSFLSKIIEKVVAARLKDHLSINNLDEKFQSAYKAFHSTETALLRVHNDILTNIDNKQSTVLILLDLSAAFDTIDQSLLINRLALRFGIQGIALKWFRSYLSGRTQSVKINECRSSSTLLKYGVPQGSVLGPVLFTLYTAPIGDIIRRNNTNYQLYADDTQLYLALNKSNVDNEIERIESCVVNIRHWMKCNFLKLNDDKTEVIHIGNNKILESVHLDHISIGDVKVKPTESIKNLGVFFDSNFQFNTHINLTCKKINFHLYNIGKLRPFIDIDTTKMLVNAFVLSNLDYCNSLLFNLPALQINKLQKLQNRAARIVTQTKPREHISLVLKQLHWLPVRERIIFKINVIVYNIQNNIDSPKYLQEIITPYTPSRSLRSQNENLLVCPPVKTKSGERTFAHGGPTLWNRLSKKTKNSKNMTSFKKSLKSELFNSVYP